MSTLSWETGYDDTGRRLWHSETLPTKQAALERLVALMPTGQSVYVDGTSTSVATAKAELATIAEVQAWADEQERKDAQRAAEARVRVVEVLTCQRQGIWKDHLNHVPDLDMARRVLVEHPSVRRAVEFAADQLLAAYTGDPIPEDT